MVSLAIADNPHFALSTLEIDRAGPSYTVDTLTEITAEIAERGLPVELYFIISTETLAGLPTWHEAARIPELARLIVTSRTGTPRPVPGWLEAHFPGLTDRFVFIDTITGAYSSSDVRALIDAGAGARYLVPPAVGAYIDRHGLYR
jgi:nicotinate-nucleotide adenylyltransferase